MSSGPHFLFRRAVSLAGHQWQKNRHGSRVTYTQWVSEEVVLVVGRARSVKRIVAAGAVPMEGADVESRASIPEVKATPGRPDIHALLRQICTEHESEQEIGVIAAGSLAASTSQELLQD